MVADNTPSRLVPSAQFEAGVAAALLSYGRCNNDLELFLWPIGLSGCGADPMSETERSPELTMERDTDGPLLSIKCRMGNSYYHTDVCKLDTAGGNIVQPFCAQF